MYLHSYICRLCMYVTHMGATYEAAETLKSISSSVFELTITRLLQSNYLTR